MLHGRITLRTNTPIKGIIGANTTGQDYLAVPVDTGWDVWTCNKYSALQLIGSFTPLELASWSSNENRMVHWYDNQKEMITASREMQENRQKERSCPAPISL